MSYRVTTAEVQAIMSIRGDWPSTLIDATPFIATANAITNLLIGNEDVDATMLYPIELYLAAHFIMGKDFTESKTGEADDKYWNKASYGFRLTSYGSQAVAMDTSGTLADMSESENKKLTFSYVYRA